MNRLDISGTEQKGLPDLLEDVTSGGAKAKTRGALEAAGDKLRDILGEDEDEEEPVSRGRKGR